MWQRIKVIIYKEVQQTLREPRMRILLILPPIIQLIIFGYAANLDLKKVRLAWMDLDRTPESRALAAQFRGSPNFELVQTLESESKAERLLQQGTAHAVVGILPGFARRLEQGKTAAVQVLVDGSNSNTASIAAGYINRGLGNYGQHSPRPVLQVKSRIWFNPELRSQVYFVPGIVVNIVALVTVVLTAMAVVREKEIGTLEQLMVTPIRPAELMLGKTLPFAAVGLLEVFLIVAAALLIFEIPFRGSALFLLLSSVLFLLTTLGAGLLISTISQTQQQAMMGSFFFFLPAFMLNGFTFPIANMPLPVQYLTYLNPTRYYMEIVRGVFLKGTGPSILWPQMLALALFGIAMITFSSIRFRKRLD